MTETGQEAYRRFIAWEVASRDTIDFKKIYVDMAGEVLAGLMLSQIVYWHLPDKHGDTKLRVERDGYLWLAKAHKDWWDEIRLTRHQADRALRILEKRRLVVTEVHKFAGDPTKHIRISNDFVGIWDFIIRSSGEPNYQERITSYIDYLTENTAEVAAADPFLGTAKEGSGSGEKEIVNEEDEPLITEKKDSAPVKPDEHLSYSPSDSAAELSRMGIGEPKRTYLSFMVPPSKARAMAEFAAKHPEMGTGWWITLLENGESPHIEGERVSGETYWISDSGSPDLLRRASAEEVEGMVRVVTEGAVYYITPERAQERMQ